MSRLGRIAIVLVVGCCCLSAEGKYGGGSGTPEDPYLIYDANHMQAIGADANDWDKCFLLIVDINLANCAGSQFNMIGEKLADTGNPFTGVFDGNGHTITNFCYIGDKEYAVGLFGYLGSDGIIKNLSLKDVNVTNNYWDGSVGALVGHCRGTVRHSSVTGTVSGAFSCGGLVGYNYYGIISDSYASGTVSGDGDFTGGLVGGNLGIISNCYSTCDVLGGNYTGGMVGENYHGTISNCFVTGTVTGLLYDVGGLVGVNVDGNILDCYAKNKVDGNHRVGGLVGYNSTKTISNCYAAGAVDGNDYIGGLVGYHKNGFYIKCFWDTEVNPSLEGIGNTTDPNIMGKSTTEMKKESTFTNACWDFVNVWGIGEKQTYPYLRRYLAGDINKDGIVNFRDFAFVALQWLEEYNVGNRRPEVVITYPEDGARLMVGGVPPQTLITAEAEDSDGTVVRVEFFDGEMKLGEDTDGSYGWSYLWTEYSLGWHTLTAVAWDEEGLSGVSAPVTVEVWMPDPPPP